MSRKDECNSLASKRQPDEIVSPSVHSIPPSNDLFKLISPYTLFLFTKSDFKTLVFPTAAFAVANVLSGCCVASVGQPHHQPSHVTGPLGFSLFHLGLAVTWSWIGLLVGTIANQRLPESVVEDSIDKPWRPVASSRVTADEARQLLVFLIGLFYVISVFLGVQGPCLAIIIFTYLYNDLKGADELIMRNILNACALMSFGAGATFILGTSTGISEVLKPSAEGSMDLTGLGWIWTFIIGLIYTTTVSTQDLPDVVGDKQRGRRTLPLVWGDKSTRVYLAISIIFWNAVCIAFWQGNVLSSAAPVAVSTLLALNLLLGRSIQDDKRSWKMWCLWVITLYSLPVLTSVSQGHVMPESMLEINLVPGING